jgi:hypothetical protein
MYHGNRAARQVDRLPAITSPNLNLLSPYPTVSSRMLGQRFEIVYGRSPAGIASCGGSLA